MLSPENPTVVSMKLLKSFFVFLKYCCVSPATVFDRIISRGVITQIFCLAAGMGTCFFLLWGIARGLSLNFFSGDDGGAGTQLSLWRAWNVFTESVDMDLNLEGNHSFGAALFRLIGAVLFGGILISTISNVIDRRVEKWSKGLLDYSFLRFPWFIRLQQFLGFPWVKPYHYVILGNGEEIIELVDSIIHGEVAKIDDGICCDEGSKKTYGGEAIVILTQSDVEALRERLYASLPNPADRWNLFFIYGDLELRESLEKVHPERAKMIFVLGECSEKCGRDIRNLSCTSMLGDIIRRALGNADAARKPIPTFVQFDGVPAYSIIQKLDCFRSANSRIDSRPFNLYENWARLLWGFYGRRWSQAEIDGYKKAKSAGKSKQPDTAEEPCEGDYFYRSLAYAPITSETDSKYVRLVTVGLGQMGQALVLEALRICHYANFRKTQNRTKITIIDRDPDIERFFNTQYPYCKQIYDIDIEFISDSVDSSEVRERLKEWACDKNCLLTVAVCFSDPDLALATGLNLPEEVYYHRDEEHPKMKEFGNTVLIRQAVYGEIGRIVNREDGRYKYVRTFGFVGKEFDAEMLRDRIPMIINGLYNAETCSMHRLDSVEDAKIRCREAADVINEKWSTLDEYLRWSNRFQADSYRVYLEYLGLKTRKCAGIGTVAREAYSDLIFDVKALEDAEKFFENSQSESPETLQKVPEILQSVVVDMEHRRWVAERTIAGFKLLPMEPFSLTANGSTKQDKVYRAHSCIRRTEDLLESRGGIVCLKDLYPIRNMLCLLAIDQYDVFTDRKEKESK